MVYISAKTKDTSSKEHSKGTEKQDKDNNNGDTDDEKHADDKRFEPPCAADSDLADMLGKKNFEVLR